MSTAGMLADLLERARELEATLVKTDDTGGAERAAADRLKRSVVRPLEEALRRVEGDQSERGQHTTHRKSSGAHTGDALWQLALAATNLRAETSADSRKWPPRSTSSRARLPD